MVQDQQAPTPEADSWVQAMSRVPERYRQDIVNSLLGAIKEYEATQDDELLDRVLRNLRTTIQLLSSPDFVKRYEESLAEEPVASEIGIEGWVARISASVGG